MSEERTNPDQEHQETQEMTPEQFQERAEETLRGILPSYQHNLLPLIRGVAEELGVPIEHALALYQIQMLQWAGRETLELRHIFAQTLEVWRMMQQEQADWFKKAEDRLNRLENDSEEWRGA